MSKKSADADHVALDYYLSGVKIDASNLPCIYNVGACYFYIGKYHNSRKWFDFAVKAAIDQSHPCLLDSYFGLSASCMKLGLY